jgi:hypothetical protein
MPSVAYVDQAGAAHARRSAPRQERPVILTALLLDSNPARSPSSKLARFFRSPRDRCLNRMMIALGSIPEQGQLAEVRRRRYMVSDVRRSAAPQSAIGAAPPQHLVSLVSIEDDALGEELQVIWELEPAARAFDKMELPVPKGFDSPARLDAFLDAVRWGAASIADTKLIQAPFYSGIEIEPYQLDPVVRAVQMPRVSLLVADDSGTGEDD